MYLIYNSQYIVYQIIISKYNILQKKDLDEGFPQITQIEYRRGRKKISVDLLLNQRCSAGSLQAGCPKKNAPRFTGMRLLNPRRIGLEFHQFLCNSFITLDDLNNICSCFQFISNSCFLESSNRDLLISPALQIHDPHFYILLSC